MFLGRAFLFGSLVTLASAASAESWQQWVDRQIRQRITLSGFRTLGYHVTRFEGDGEAFELQNYSGFGGRRFTDIGQLSLSGRRVLGLLNFEATILDSRFDDPQAQRFSIDFERDGWTVNLGDVQGSLLNTNRLATFSRSLRGAQVGYKGGNFAAKAVRSQAKGSARTVTLTGNNSPGPYYLQASQLIAESELIEVDGIPQRRGVDYTISYEAGAIQFVGRSISTTNTITATFETFGVNTRLGNLDGVGVSYSMGKAGQIGLTVLSQKAPGSGGTSTRLEKFFGFGPPSAPYALQFEPLRSQPITIRVNGQIQVENVDYAFDTTLPAVFYFNRFMRSTDEIDVIYTPKPTATVDGDREVIGIDYTIPVGRQGSVTYAQALGRLKSDATPSKGLARSLDMRYTFGDPAKVGRVEATVNLRDVAPGYVSIDSRTFNRNEKAIETRLDYAPTTRSTAGIRHQNSLVSTRFIDSNGDLTFRPTRVTSLDGSYTLNAANASTLRLDTSRRRSVSGNQATNIDSIGLSITGNLKRGSYAYGIQHQRGRSPSSGTTNAPQQGFLVNGITARADWLALARGGDEIRDVNGQQIRVPRPAENLRLNTRLELNQTERTGRSSLGRLLELGAAYTNDRWEASLIARDNNTGSIASLGGFTGGTGVGLDGSGFSNGTTDLLGLGRSSSQDLIFTASYRLSERASLQLDTAQIKSSGGIQSNSTTRTFGVGANWEMGTTRGTARLDQTLTTFSQSAVRSSATTLSLGLSGDFGPRWRYDIRANSLVSGGSSTFRQSGTTFEGNLSYVLGRRQTLSYDWALSDITGFRGQRDLGSSLTYSYQLWNSLALNASYRFRDVRNREEGISTGAYRFNGFDFVLSFDFGR